MVVGGGVNDNKNIIRQALSLLNEKNLKMENKFKNLNTEQLYHQLKQKVLTELSTVQ